MDDNSQEITRCGCVLWHADENIPKIEDVGGFRISVQKKEENKTKYIGRKRKQTMDVAAK